MSLQHLYLEEQVIASETTEVFSLRLSSDDVKHLKVLRVQPGEHFAVIDASQDYFECEVVSFDGAETLVRICGHREDTQKRPRVTLIQGLAKGDKVDDVIRHATELGVSEFIPLACSRSVLKLDAAKAKKRTERWRAIAKSGAMQSGQPALPVVHEPASVRAVKQLLERSVVLVCWEEAPESCSLNEALQQLTTEYPGICEGETSVAVVVGPEGGLDQQEVDMLLSYGIASHLVSLGSTILRTETAGVVAPALCLYQLGCLGGGARKPLE